MNSLTFCLRRYWLNWHHSENWHPDNKELCRDLGFKGPKSVPFSAGNVQKVSAQVCRISYSQWLSKWRQIFPFGAVFSYEYVLLLNVTETMDGMKNQNLCLPGTFVTIRAACGVNINQFDTTREKYTLSSWCCFWLTLC